MAVALQFVLNGRIVRVENCSPNTTLLEFLRGAGLTGSKEGCAEGDAARAPSPSSSADADGQPVYRAVNSCLCLLPARRARGNFRRRHRWLGKPASRSAHDGRVSRLAIVMHTGLHLLNVRRYYRDDLHTHDDLDDQLSGNLCRCTVYRPIRDAPSKPSCFVASRGNELKLDAESGKRKTEMN